MANTNVEVEARQKCQCLTAVCILQPLCEAKKIERVLCGCGKRQGMHQLRALNSDIRRPHREAVCSQGHGVRNVLCSWGDSNSHL